MRHIFAGLYFVGGIALTALTVQDELATAQMNSWGPGLWGLPE